MALQTIDTVTPDVGLKTVAEKLNNNFTDSENAASKLVGYQTGRLPLADVLKDKRIAVFDVTGTGPISASFEQAGRSIWLIIGASGDDRTISMPNDDTGAWIVIFKDTGGNTITIETNTGSGVEFSNFGENRQIYSDGTDIKNLIMDRPGDLLFNYGLPGFVPPPKENWIKLQADLTGAGQYNEGKLTNQVTTNDGTDLETITAEIDDAESPMNGETINLAMSEQNGRVFRAGTSPGTVANDQMQQITGSINSQTTGTGYFSGAGGIGALDATGSVANVFQQGGPAASLLNLTFDSANSPNARTGTYTRAKEMQVDVYLCFKV